MGTTCNKQPTAVAHKTVTYLTNSIPDDNKYKAIDTDSLRFSDITAYKSQRNQYLFTMSMRNQIDIRQCIPVLNQIVHCIGCQNYQLSVRSRMIVDIFDRKFTTTLIDVCNQKTMSQYSMKIVPYNTYNSFNFKKAFYQLYLNKQIGSKMISNVRLMDYFIYGMNPGEQAFVFLFEKCVTSLANVAEYRKQANMPWNDKEKLKVIHQIFESYQILYHKNIVHRDLRPSNIFYVATTGRFAIGNFSRARLLRRNYQADLMSVCGVPDFSCQQMQILMMKGQHIGHYEAIKQDYAGLKSILNMIQTCQIYDKNPMFKNQQIAQIADMLNKGIQFKKIMDRLTTIVHENNVVMYADIGDREIAQSCAFLLAHTHKHLIDSYLFQVYGYLGYHKNYSDKAHKMLEKNNQNLREVDNAPILRNLGEFYQSKGSQGTQYYYNAFVLYILRADNQIRYGYPEKAQNQLTNARETYFKFNRTIQSQLPRIQINRVSSLIELEKGNTEQAIKMINQTFVKAAQNNIPVDKQCKVLLAFGKIYRRLPETQDEALKKLSTGLSICDNVGAFESPATCRVFKAKFLREIGGVYADKVAFKSDPRKKVSQQSNAELKAQAQTHLRSALQIQQRQAVDDMQVADTLQQLGRLHYSQQNFYDAKKYYDTAKIRLAHISESVNPIKQLNVVYTRGSCCYYLKQFNQARIDYQACLKRLETMPPTQENQIMAYNIQGNLGLALMQLGNSEGRNRVQNAMQQLKERKGEKSFDYFILAHSYAKLIGA